MSYPRSHKADPTLRPPNPEDRDYQGPEVLYCSPSLDNLREEVKTLVITTNGIATPTTISVY